MTRIAAVILAGGHGERLGGANKALLEIRGGRLVDRMAALLAGCAPILLSVGTRDFAVPGLVPVKDLAADYGGPLAGVAAAIGHLRADPPDLLLTVAVDTPRFPSGFLAMASGLLGDSDVVMASYAGQDYPTNALWRFAAVAGLADEVLAGTAPHSLKRLAERLAVTRLDYARTAPDDPFRSLNTPEDLAFFEGRPAPGEAG